MTISFIPTPATPSVTGGTITAVAPDTPAVAGGRTSCFVFVFLTGSCYWYGHGIYKGYILTRERIESGHSHRFRYAGISDQGPFEIIITNNRPLFFILRDANLPKRIFHCERRNVNLTTFDGRPVDGVYFKTQHFLYKARQYYEAQGIQTFEADIHPEERYLMERFIHGVVLMLDGNAQQTAGSLALRMHADPSGEGKGMDDVLPGYPFEILSEGGRLYWMSDERALLKGFLNVMDVLDPDMIIGWHVIGFDLLFLEKKYRDCRVPFLIGRDHGPPRIQAVRKGLFRADVCGRIVIDGPPALRAAFYSFDNFRLETVASALLGAGKDIGEEKDKVAEIERRFLEDKRGVARYNLLDCKLVSDIFEKTGLIDFIYKRATISGFSMTGRWWRGPEKLFQILKPMSMTRILITTTIWKSSSNPFLTLSWSFSTCLSTGSSVAGN